MITPPKKGLEERANVVVDQIDSSDTSTKPPLAIYGKPRISQVYQGFRWICCTSAVSG
ncbi:MAG: hypothetical protein JWQ04_466 [Pedosphaera sp.]|nr:hypothetical protein [Pedosphaera sp.]